MKILKYIFILFIIFPISAQESFKVIQKLDTAFVHFLSKKTEHCIDKSHFLKNPVSNIQSKATLSEFLSDESNIYIKEYGRGMLSSISIRGTGATHTQILWNGIPVNSSLNGQTDLNTVYLDNENQLLIKKGGESVFYGSGAIGGVIFLNHLMNFSKKFQFENNFNYGSYDTYINSTKLTYSNSKIYLNGIFTGNFSKNNYIIPKIHQSNLNGEYQGKNFGLNAGYKVNFHNQINFLAEYNFLNRNLSQINNTYQKPKLITKNYRNLLSWKYHNKKWLNQLSTAWLQEFYKYFHDKSKVDFTNNQAQNFFLKNESFYHTKRKYEIIFGQSFQHTKGIGDGIGKHFQNTLAIYGSVRYHTRKIFGKISLRKEWNTLYKIPLLASLWFSKKIGNYQFGMNISNNFRSPTFNDLYWSPGGNPNLKPEKSYTIEADQSIKINSFKADLNLFFIKSHDLIQWQPVTQNFWQPINVQQVISKGVEISMSKKIIFSKKNYLNIHAAYTFQNVTDNKSNYALTYIPTHLGQINILYSNKKLSGECIARYTGKVYTTTSNTLFLEPYLLTDLKFSYQINHFLALGVGVFNLMNTYYETYPAHPQPGRNYHLNINIKIQ